MTPNPSRNHSRATAPTDHRNAAESTECSAGLIRIWGRKWHQVSTGLRNQCSGSMVGGLQAPKNASNQKGGEKWCWASPERCRRNENGQKKREKIIRKKEMG